jgi:hypothetical protein
MEARLGATLRFVLSEREEFAAPHRIGSMAKARAAACNCAAGGQTKCEYYIQLFYMRPLQRGTALHMPLIDPLTRRSQHALLLHIPSFLPHSPAATRTHRLLVTPRARAPSHDAREDLPHSAFGGLLRLDNPCRSRSRCRLARSIPTARPRPHGRDRRTRPYPAGCVRGGGTVSPWSLAGRRDYRWTKRRRRMRAGKARDRHSQAGAAVLSNP